MLLHAPSTLRLIGRCLGDPRSPVVSKVLFLGVTGFLLLAALVPEVGADAALFLTPVVGPVFDLFGIPLEAGFDWGFLVLVLPLLLNLFPAEVRAEQGAKALPPPQS